MLQSLRSWHRCGFGLAVTAATIARGLWATYCVHASLTQLRGRRAHPTSSNTAAAAERESTGDPATIVVVVPMLHEVDRAVACIDHWSTHLHNHEQLRLCVVTTERERLEASTQLHTWNVLDNDPRLQAFTSEGRAEHLHYLGWNRTYGEQLGWALDQLSRGDSNDYLYIANVDSRLAPEACAEIIDLAGRRVDCAQQSALFLGNLDQLSWIATGEALYQTRWTFQVELFRYLAGSRAIAWLPARLQDQWYQHAVGHGLLIARHRYLSLGGLPRPRYGLEDAALGYAIRASGGRIEPFKTLEVADAPTSLAELQRQRSTWVRGPLCAPEYQQHASQWPLTVQGLWSGLRWAFGVPALASILTVLRPRHRAVAAAGITLGLYGPLFRLLVGLRTEQPGSTCLLTTRAPVRGITAYPLAAISCWVGGFRGLLRLLTEVAADQPSIQQQTRSPR